MVHEAIAMALLGMSSTFQRSCENGKRVWLSPHQLHMRNFTQWLEQTLGSKSLAAFTLMSVLERWSMRLTRTLGDSKCLITFYGTFHNRAGRGSSFLRAAARK